MATEILKPSGPFFKPFKGPKVTARTPLRKESEKRQGDRVIYTQKRKAYLESHTFCEFDGCARVATDIHHKARRGAHYLDESTFFGTCRVHHRWIHDNPIEAKAMNLLI